MKFGLHTLLAGAFALTLASTIAPAADIVQTGYGCAF